MTRHDLDDLAAALRAGPLPDVPRSLHRLAVGVSEERPERGRLRHLVASLVERLSGTSPVPAMRGGGPPVGARQLYRAESYDIDIAFRDGTLIGQIIADGPDSDDEFEDAVCILHGEPERMTRVEPTGEFQFETIEPGTYQISIAWNDSVLVLPDVGIPRAGDQ